jgi:anti-sigma factor RsiW
MTSHNDKFSEYDFSSSNDLEDAEAHRFELLSAYIDGEATVAERKQVQQWLDNDPEIKQTYLQLLQLQDRMQNLSVPSQAISADILTERVFNQIDRRNRKKAIIWGGAIAATVVATVSSLIPLPTSSLRMAKDSIQNQVSKPMMVAVSLNKPTVVIPKAAVAAPNRINRI